MQNKLNKILELVNDYITEKHNNIKWMPGDWITYSGPTYSSDEYIAAIETLLGEWLIFGKKANEFENSFPKYVGKTWGTLVNSGSSANLLMFSVLKSKRGYNLKPSAKFITPVVGFPTTINPIIQSGFEPVFVDVTLPDLNLNLDKVEEILETDPEIRGIIFAHVLGNPPDMDRVMQLVKKYNLIFLEDACDALGSTYDNKLLGSFGEMSSMSFFPAHHMTMGEGGFVATDSYKMKQILSSFRDWGRACHCNTSKPGDVTSETACGNRFRNWFKNMPDIIYDHRYVFDEIGYNLKPLDLQAAMGLEQLKKLKYFDAARRKNFKKLYNIFEKYDKYFYMPRATTKSNPNWFAFPLTVKETAPFSKHDLVLFLEKYKIQTRSYFSGNILYHSAYKEYADKYINLIESFPIAHLVTNNTFFIGTYIGITDDKLNYIEETIKLFIETVL